MCDKADYYVWKLISSCCIKILSCYQQRKFQQQQRNLRRQQQQKEKTNVNMQILTKSQKNRERDRLRQVRKWQKQYG